MMLEFDTTTRFPINMPSAHFLRTELANNSRPLCFYFLSATPLFRRFLPSSNLLVSNTDYPVMILYSKHFITTIHCQNKLTIPWYMMMSEKKAASTSQLQQRDWRSTKEFPLFSGCLYRFVKVRSLYCLWDTNGQRSGSSYSTHPLTFFQNDTSII